MNNEWGRLQRAGNAKRGRCGQPAPRHVLPSFLLWPVGPPRDAWDRAAGHARVTGTPPRPGGSKSPPTGLAGQPSSQVAARLQGWSSRAQVMQSPRLQGELEGGV